MHRASCSAVALAAVLFARCPEGDCCPAQDWAREPRNSFALITIGCPSCCRRLRLPATLQGKVVKCPGCGLTFTATASMEARRQNSMPEPPPLPPLPCPALAEETAAGPPREYDAEEGDAPCPFCAELIDRDSRRCRHCGAQLDPSTRPGQAPFWVRRDCEPHRGAWIQLLGVASLLLGVLSLFLCGVPSVLALPFGLAAWVMSGRDLAKMEAGLMDPAGMAPTRTGRQCGIIGVVFSLLCGGGWGFVGIGQLLRLL